MIENNPDLTNAIVTEHQDQLRRERHKSGMGRSSIVRVALGTTLIRIGQRIAGQCATTATAPTPPKLATR